MNGLKRGLLFLILFQGAVISNAAIQFEGPQYECFTGMVAFNVYGELKALNLKEKYITQFPENNSGEEINATAVLRIIVLPDGTVDKNIMLEKSSGNAKIDEMAIASVRLFKFDKAPIESTKKVEGIVEMKITVLNNRIRKSFKLPLISEKRKILEWYVPRSPEWVIKQKAKKVDEIELEFVVLPSGVVENVVVLKSTGYKELDDRAVEALHKCLFKPLAKEKNDLEDKLKTSFQFDGSTAEAAEMEIIGNLKGRKLRGVLSFERLERWMIKELDKEEIVVKCLVSPIGTVISAEIYSSTACSEINSMLLDSFKKLRYSALEKSAVQEQQEGMIKFTIKFKKKRESDSAQASQNENNVKSEKSYEPHTFQVYGQLKDRPILEKYIPKYPRWAEEQGIEADVALHCLVAPDGRVASIEVEKSSGYEELDELGRKALNAMKFAPLNVGEDQEQNEGIVVFLYRLMK